VAAAGIDSSDAVLEIGPGLGAITHLVAARAAQMVAFEIDRGLAARLKAAAPANLTIVEGDFLEQTPATVRAALPHGSAPHTRIRVIGNLPYNVASPILFKLLALRGAGLPLSDAVVMVQREVADRLIASPGTKDYGVLSILIRHQADVERILTLPPGAFRPMPKVHSAVVRLTFHAPEPIPHNAQAFQTLVKSLFTRRRKMLSNALAAYTLSGADQALERAGIDGRRRPETLDLAELVALSDALE
jgi:16S rRNA (adenine1518-N6/adenine1519-N6)-dimethyltransferase